MTLNKITLLIGGIFLTSLCLLLPWYPLQLGAGLLLLSFWPGYALLTTLFFETPSLPLRPIEALLSIAVSYGLTISLLLFLVFAQMPINQLSMAGSLAGFSLILTFVAWRRQPPLSTANLPTSQAPSLTIHSLLPESPASWLLLVLLIAAFFRLTNVGYSEHQGDEADILLRAVMLVHGDVEALLTHSKGPGEILLLSGIGMLSGQFDEQTVRLLFSIAGTISVGLIFLLGWRLFSLPVGIIAGLLAAIDGVFVSYARTAQYQSVVLLLTLAAIFCLYQVSQAQNQRRGWHLLGTFLLSVSFLVHFETVFLLPVVLYLSMAPFISSTSSTSSNSSRQFFGLNAVTGLGQIFRRGIQTFWPSLLLFFSLTGLFYIPFLLHPKVGATGTYLENRISGGDLPPFNNLAHFFYFEALKYNSAYYVALFAILLLGAAVWVFGRAIRREGLPESDAASPPVGLSLLCSGSVGIGLLLILLELQKLSALFIAVGFAIFFLVVILSPRLSLPMRSLWLWIAPPFWVYVFLVNRPGKHHYVFLAALTLLVGWAAVQGWQEAEQRWPILQRRTGRWLAAGAGAALLLLFAGHTVMVLLRSDLEYVLTYPDHKSNLYPTDEDYPYGTRIGFGYPFRLGWQAVGQLKRSGHLSGTWAANDDGNAPNWYMLNTPQTLCYPDYVLRGEITYKGDDDFDVPFEPENFGYVPRYRIWVNDQLRMTILAFDPLAEQTTPLDLDGAGRRGAPVTAADFTDNLDDSSPPVVPPEIVLEPAPVLGEGSEIKQNAPQEYLERAQTLNGRVALTGYTLNQQFARPGSVLPITLYWQVQSLLSLRYKVFVHLISPEGALVAQADDFPLCGTFHANAWGVGGTVADRYLLRLPAELAPGTYTLLVGMYEPDLQLRLNYFDIAGNEQGNSVPIGQVEITP